MKIQVASDIHLEFRCREMGQILKPSADILILAGDICVLGAAEDRDTFTKFIDLYSKRYKHILHVAGNHEYYSGEKQDVLSMGDIHKFLAKLGKQYPNYSFLHNKVLPLTDPRTKKTYNFAGTTLWTHIPEDKMKFIQESMNDYAKILVKQEILTPDMVNRLHKEAVSFLRRTLKTHKNIVLITHHKPFLDPQPKNPFSVAYEVDLQHLLKPPVLAAIHGHTHQHFQSKMNGVTVVSNPRGYPYERTNFNPAFVINI